MALSDFLLNTGNKISNALHLSPVQFNNMPQAGMKAVAEAESQDPSLWDRISASTKNALFGKQAPLNENIVNFQNQLRNNGVSENTINAIPQGLNSGNKQIADFITNYNKSEAGLKAPINIPQTQEQINLAKQGNFNQSPRIGGFVPDLINGFKENLQNDFKGSNWNNDNLDFNRSKGLSYKIGEGAGSLARFAQSPLGRSLIVGGLIAGMGGTGAEALTYGASTGMLNQQNRMKDQLYRQSLKDNYGFSDEELNGITGYLNDTTFKNLADTSYKNKKMQQTQQLAFLKDNTSKAKLIGDWLKAGQITPQEASQLITAYGITNADFQVADSTRAINSRIAVDNARIENINNPKPKTIIHKSNNSTGATRQGEGVGKRISINKTKIEAPNGQIYLVDSNRVQEYINAGGKVVQ